MSIRFATQQDIPAILQIYGPYVENTAISFEYSVPSQEEFTQRFHKYTRQFPWLVWEEDGSILGYAYGSAPFERAAYGWCAEASIYLAPQAHRRGIGRKLYTALEHLLTLQGYRKLYALVTTANPPSVQFHLAMGYRHLVDFKDCGFKFGSWHGVTWLEKDLYPVDLTMIPPKSIGEIVGNAKILQNILDSLSLS